MSDETNSLWTITELAAEVATALAEAEVDQSSGRVTEVPSTRTIRYYTTHGLLDAPSAFKGRTAFYGPRHLQQLVAIKRLQARGATLVEIQTRLVSADDAVLADLAGVAEPAPRTEAPRRAESFWASPAPPAAPVEPQVEARQLELPNVYPALELESGLTLVLSGATRSLHPDDIEAIRVAAAPLVKLLNRRNILSGN